MSEDSAANAPETFSGDPLTNSILTTGKYREVATGDTVEVTEVGIDFVNFHYATRGLRTPHTLPLRDFTRIGRFVPHV